ncbi:hypothetical protein BRADI_4g20215v3 [Brachypodium distachyon]|uniref:Uncharacterized protein n=1 Tax=Brachypodium distachyon TaxID=15368 RepID=A0A2K2CNX1_BRADI|nr:hypothetical protein BRADI_4g20215v3 [Brachypodium distachyon]
MATLSPSPTQARPWAAWARQMRAKADRRRGARQARAKANRQRPKRSEVRRSSASGGRGVRGARQARAKENRQRGAGRTGGTRSEARRGVVRPQAAAGREGQDRRGARQAQAKANRRRPKRGEASGGRERTPRGAAGWRMRRRETRPQGRSAMAEAASGKATTAVGEGGSAETKERRDRTYADVAREGGNKGLPWEPPGMRAEGKCRGLPTLRALVAALLKTFFFGFGP